MGAAGSTAYIPAEYSGVSRTYACSWASSGQQTCLPSASGPTGPTYSCSKVSVPNDQGADVFCTSSGQTPYYCKTSGNTGLCSPLTPTVPLLTVLPPPPQSSQPSTWAQNFTLSFLPGNIWGGAVYKLYREFPPAQLGSWTNPSVGKQITVLDSQPEVCRPFTYYLTMQTQAGLASGTPVSAAATGCNNPLWGLSFGFGALSASGVTVALGWDFPPDPSLNITYTLTRTNPDGSQTPIPVPIGATSVLDSNVTPGSTYSYTLLLSDSAGNTMTYGPNSATIPGNPPPPAPPGPSPPSPSPPSPSPPAPSPPTPTPTPQPSPSPRYILWLLIGLFLVLLVIVVTILLLRRRNQKKPETASPGKDRPENGTKPE